MTAEIYKMFFNKLFYFDQQFNTETHELNQDNFDIFESKKLIIFFYICDCK